MKQLDEFFEESSQAYFDKLKNNPDLTYKDFLRTWNDPKIRFIDVDKVWRSLNKRARNSNDARYKLKERNNKKIPRDKQLEILEAYDNINHEDEREKERLRRAYLGRMKVKKATFKTWTKNQEYDLFSMTIMPKDQLLW